MEKYKAPSTKKTGGSLEVTEIFVKSGDKVEVDEKLLKLKNKNGEEFIFKSPENGKVKQIYCEKGSKVNGNTIIEIKAEKVEEKEQEKRNRFIPSKSKAKSKIGFWKIDSDKLRNWFIENDRGETIEEEDVREYRFHRMKEIEDDIKKPREEETTSATSEARKLAFENKIDISNVRPTGETNNSIYVTREDVVRYCAKNGLIK